jgi:hypothetical protein
LRKRAAGLAKAAKIIATFGTLRVIPIDRNLR